MKHSFLTLFLLLAAMGNAQSVVQSVNSGSLIAANTMAAIGEIVVIPAGPNQSPSGIIGILAQTDATLEVTHFDVTQNITVYPNPTVAQITFKSPEDLSGQKVSVYNNAGQLAFEKQIDDQNSLDLQALPTGIYLIRFADKKFNSFKIIKH